MAECVDSKEPDLKAGHSAIFALLILAAANGAAGAEKPVVAEAGPAVVAPTPPKNSGPETICGLIEAAATDHRIPVDYLTRLIWRESSFRPGAVSPKGARGIAQFMPATAARRRLADPFDPVEAIPASARYLHDLAGRFGNLGLAAAAYNAGERRVDDWLDGGPALPSETRGYVIAVTGRSAEDWSSPNQNVLVGPPPGPELGCLKLAASLARPGAGTEAVERFEQGTWAPWGVLVAGNFSLSRAMASYGAVKTRHAAILAPDPPLVVRVVDRSRGRAPIFQIRVQANSREEAARLCGSLHAAGAACLIVRN